MDITTDHPPTTASFPDRPPDADDVPDLPVHSGLRTVRRFVDEILNEGRFDTMSELVDPDYRYHGPDGTEVTGYDGLAALIGEFRTGFPDLRGTPAIEVADGCVVAVTMILTGTHDGEFLGIPATGARLELPLAIVTRLVDDRIAEDWEYYDSAVVLAQLGVDPSVRNEEPEIGR